MKNGVSNSYFVKIEEIIGKEEKDVYFGYNMLPILFWRSSGRSSRLVQWVEWGISAPRTEGLSVYQWSVPEKKQAWLLRKWLFKFFPELRFVLEILEHLKVIANELPEKCVTSLEPPLSTSQNRRSVNHLAFLFITLVDSTPFLIYSRNSTCYNFHPQSIAFL